MEALGLNFADWFILIVLIASGVISFARGFTKEFLIKFSTMSPTIGEKKLKLEQLRALENNIPINIELTNLDSQGINTPSDLLKLKENFKIE